MRPLLCTAFGVLLASMPAFADVGGVSADQKKNDGQIIIALNPQPEPPSQPRQIKQTTIKKQTTPQRLRQMQRLKRPAASTVGSR